MKISNNPPQHLSNYEVLQHFLALKKDNDVLLRATEAKKNRDIKGAYDQIPLVTRRGEIGGPEIPDVPPVSAAQRRREDDAARRGVSKDLVWVQDEVLKYLCADYNATARQTADGVRAVADGLQDYGLTKAELLQACNLAPINQVGMYLIMEEAEKRFQHYPGGYEQTVGTIISEVIEPSLLHEVPEELEPFVTSVQAKEIAQTILEDAAAYAEEEEMMYQEEEFVHEAEWGAGKEAAADDEEDNTMD
ncbi:hypothetical protein CC85DRAFT_100675 [Cutaneotrichosporon oleaginosum]|uniref:DNA-directed RNA polymerase III subunit RPC9 n=1 Tax=Cutaneotrichosporon oleaginosum TaxID=879819 RepID=A0A0J0XLR0_9TREE|nr:uncharacterized protein CC85DRAFT_100675 [Cutaneotrichosporon oleaginosum]KLT42003.1 hypothetical protein CC85DRAFT_100675 [Cutaneotrichosporon oleaginosum]